MIRDWFLDSWLSHVYLDCPRFDEVPFPLSQSFSRFSRITTLLDEHGYVNALSHVGTFSHSVFSVLENALWIFFSPCTCLCLPSHMLEPYPSFPWTNIILFFSINQFSIHYTEWNCSVLRRDKHWSVVDKVHCVYYFRFVRCSRIEARNIRVWVNRSSC